MELLGLPPFGGATNEYCPSKDKGPKCSVTRSQTVWVWLSESDGLVHVSVLTPPSAIKRSLLNWNCALENKSLPVEMFDL
jgi:hypothetical protein